MSDYKPKVGDRVKVTKHYTYEGVVQRVDDKYFAINGGGFPGFSLMEKNLVVEKLADPEPKWLLGHVVQDRDGTVWAHDAGMSWIGIPRGIFRRDYDMHRPLTILAVPVDTT